MISVKQKKRAKRIAILSILILLLVAALCFVFGYAISEGWGAVAAWFTGQWALLTIIAATLVVIGLVLLYFKIKDKEDFK